METHAHRRASSDIFDTRRIGCNASTLEDYGNIGAGLDRRIAKVCPMIAVLALYVAHTWTCEIPAVRRRHRLRLVIIVVAVVVVVVSFVIVVVDVVIVVVYKITQPSCKRFGTHAGREARRDEKFRVQSLVAEIYR